LSYSLDTNVCIASINGSRPDVRKRFDLAVATRETVYLSSIVLFELWYGVWNSSKIDENRLRLQRFVAGPITLLLFEAADAEPAGSLRTELKAIGRPIGPYDLLIAAQAKMRGITLVTRNLREFGRIEGLTVENWEA
jgi:tRNA(fMet)-specific endonuclease VapC